MEQVVTFVATSVILHDAMHQVQAEVNTWLEEHPHAVISTLDTELVPREHNAGEWVFVVALAVRLPESPA